MPFEPLRSLRPWIAGALALGLVATGGCFNDDDAPGGSSDTANIDDEVAWGTASNAVDATQAILENIGDWTQNGIQATGRAQSASWDPVTGAWTITGNEDYDDGDATGSTTFTFVVQFSAAGTPQQQPDDLTDRIDVTLDATNEGNYHPSTETWTIDYDWAAHSEATATALAGGGGALVGTGTITGSTVAHIGEAAIPGSQDLSWDIDLVMPDGSCPTGTVSGEMAPWSFTAVLDGTTEMVVTLYHNGAYVASEIDEAPCGGGNTGQATYYTLEGVGFEGLEQAADALALAPSWASGTPQFPNGRAAFSWNPGEGVWTFGDSWSGQDGDRQITYNATWSVQYLDGEVPQQQPDASTDSMRIGVFAHVVGTQTDQEGTLDFDWQLESAYSVTGFPSGPFAVTGEGDVIGSMAFDDGLETHDWGVDVHWTVAGSAADASCPSGSYTATSGDATFSAEFDGAGYAAVLLTAGDDTWLSTTVSVPCAD